ncbi:hypothetical protein BU14_0284s0012 [Porphyra umbilicalis]|uniref:Uncharacterized protein n=1 Tax=Porphyra umbilicalis TaxID=2786 RepID=A0A1X6P1C9_PORUM|nr:hypothetical protein BU14_0284s0012 [Porphyra umbilicalis]|eukprot:OSX74560.1 hypothetical protein BU14_0284s0012 [Porphyra umbilicalis]
MPPTQALNQWPLALLLLLAAALGSSPPPVAAERDARCVDTLRTAPAAFDACRTGKVCWLCITEPPFIWVDSVDAATDARRRRPFNCSDHGAYGLRGSSFQLLNTVAPGDLCVFAGDSTECKFNELVDYLDQSATEPSHPGYGVALGIHGALLTMPHRVGAGSWLPPIFHEKMVIVQSKSVNDVHPGSVISEMWYPFTSEAWRLLLTATGSMVIISLALSLFRPEPVGVQGWRRPGRMLTTYTLNVIHNTFGGHPEGPLSATAVAFEPARRALRYAYLCLAAVTLLYYEAALIVSQTNPVLSKRLRGLPNNDLCQFSVLDASALGDSFASVVAGGDRGRLPEIKARWLPAPNLLASFAHLAGGVRNSRPGCPPGITAKYLVSFESVVAGVLMANASLCDDLQVVATEEELRDWDAGWVLTAAAHNGGTALPPSIAATVRRHKVSVDRRLLEEKHKEGGVPQGGHLLASACGGTVGPRVRASQLVMPLALSVFVPTTITAVLAVVYPLLLGVLGRGRGAGGGAANAPQTGAAALSTAGRTRGGGWGGFPPGRRRRGVCAAELVGGASFAEVALAAACAAAMAAAAAAAAAVVIMTPTQTTVGGKQAVTMGLPPSPAAQDDHLYHLRHHRRLPRTGRPHPRWHRRCRWRDCHHRHRHAPYCGLVAMTECASPRRHVAFHTIVKCSRAALQGRAARR